ncbi:peptidase S8/S53 domain-containing protein, partial [Syncephalis plumigaleata]
GTGYKIGIIDSGVDYLHPDLGGCFGAGCKIAYGYDFVGDAYTGMNEPRPDADPMDECNGHGTHVAGIIGASSSIAPGVAPGATLGAYRVFGCQG